MNQIKTSLLLALALAFVPLLPGSLQAQRETERFIPIGQSPGVSGTLSSAGEIESVDEDALVLTVRTDGGSITFRLTADTQIWIDRSAQQLTNLVGGYEDCEVGRTVEVMFVDPQRREQADWIKVAGSPPR